MQHTSTHSTRLVALTSASSSSDSSKRTKCTQQTSSTVPLPLPAHTLIKIEEGVNTGHHHSQSSAQTTSIFEQEKSLQTASIQTTSVQTPTEINGQFFYQHPGLIQIAPQPTPILEATECRHSASSPPPLQLTAAAAAAVGLQTHSSSISDTQLGHIVPPVIPPEVQDANIQTSPIMSEDDNSSGHDGPHHESNFEDETSQDRANSPVNEKPIITSIETEPELTREEIAEHRESVPDTSVTSSSLIMNIKQQIESPDTSINDAKDDEIPEQPSQSEEQKELQREPVDLSGLQLLSNSIDVFQKKIIKQEPSEQQITSPTIASTTITPPIPEIVPEEKPLISIPRSSVSKSMHEDAFGGLTLLCALAEQRLEEDFQSNTTTSPSTNDLEGQHETKKRKHKVKSSKKSKHKEMKKAKKRKHSENENDEHDELKNEFAASFKRVKTKIDNLPITSVDDVFRLMEQDMQQKLASITRQCEEKKRELKQIKTDTSEKEIPLSSSLSPDENKASKSPAVPLKLSIVPALSPSFSSSSNSDSLVDIPKLSSDTDSGSKDDGDGSNTERSKRKFSIPNKNNGDKQQTETIVAKKSKSFVGYIFASKHQNKLPITATVTTSTSSPTIDSWTSSIKNGKASLPFVKTEDHDGRGILKESAFKDDRVFSIFGDGTNSQKFQASSPLTIPSVSRHQQPFIKHHSKHKKHKERRRHRERQRLDSRVKISSEHLKQAKTRVLMAQGGLFYAGTLTPVEPSEVYAITLDGERGNKPHIMPRDEIFKQAVSFY